LENITAADGSSEALFVISGDGTIEASDDLRTWIPVKGPLFDNGIEHMYREQKRTHRYFRFHRTQP
jgi:hypothetical protein